MPLGLSDFTHPQTSMEKAEMAKERALWAAADKRIAELEAALQDAYPMVCIYVDKYAREYDCDGLHPSHAEMADRIARLIGVTDRLPSVVLGKN